MRVRVGVCVCACMCQQDVFTQHRLSLSCFPLCAFCSTPIPPFWFLSRTKRGPTARPPTWTPPPSWYFQSSPCYTHTHSHISNLFSLSISNSNLLEYLGTVLPEVIVQGLQCKFNESQYKKKYNKCFAHYHTIYSIHNNIMHTTVNTTTLLYHIVYHHERNSWKSLKKNEWKNI